MPPPPIPKREVTHTQIAKIWIDVTVRVQHNGAAQVTRHPVEDGVDITDHVRVVPDQVQLEGIVSNQPLELPGSHVDGVTASEGSFELALERMRNVGSSKRTIEGEPSLGMLGLVPLVGQASTLLRTVGVDVRSKRRFEMITPKGEVRAQQLRAVGLKFSQRFDRVTAVRSALWAALKARKPVQVITAQRVYESMIIVDLSFMDDATNIGALRFGATAEEIRVVKSSTGLVGVPDPLNVRAKPVADAGNQNTTPAADEVPVEAKDKISVLKQILDGGSFDGMKAAIKALFQ